MGELDVLAEPECLDTGTLVMMLLDHDSLRTEKDVFNQSFSPDGYTFDRTIVPERLAAYEGENWFPAPRPSD